MTFPEFAPSPDRMPALVNWFQADWQCLERRLDVPYSPQRWNRLGTFFDEWRQILTDTPFDDLTPSDKADWLLLRGLLNAETRRLHREREQFAAIEPLLPFAADLVALEESRRRHEDVDPENAAERLARALVSLRQTQQVLTDSPIPPNAGHAALAVNKIRAMLDTWFSFRFGYDPLFAWWVERPFRALDKALGEYAERLNAQTANGEMVLEAPLGRDALIEELQNAQITDTPEELVAAARTEWDWCRTELRRAARDMNCGDDWRAALEQVKRGHETPGNQPALVRNLAQEAIAYVQENDLVTVPPLAAECWRMEMMSAERQKVNPFFLGGEAIVVSFPTHEMDHAEKRMSLRGNNRAFARATVQHELIPGHGLQEYFQTRVRPYRQLFFTPFWTEGWTLHWEMLLWERDFARTPEERVGMLFWRLHRAARVIFSLGYHLGTMTAPECVEMLVNEVGHERENALAEVRRSFAGDYPPLYQCAYLVGGWQMHGLYHEMTAGGMTPRAFHDAVLAENCMPIPTLHALLRA
ncbi:MAG: DUF885 domain-containing protein, partial [Armatimonadota bacterium]|nr:DUF885 domain-containing protein [Armatimonadota bacterium]